MRDRFTVSPVVALALVSVLYAVAQLIVISPRMGIGWDEAVYASQYASHAPASMFTAPRARGVALLVAPVVAITDSVLALRLYLTVVSTAALFGAFFVWSRVRNGYVVPVAALLFGGCWLALFYGDQAMPNLYIALTAVAAVGFLLLAERSRWSPVGLAAAVAVMALMRPSDAVVAAVAMAASAVVVLRRRQVITLVALAVGLAAGWSQWIAEAQQRFGGPLARLQAAQETNAAGLTVSIVEHARALDGPLLCRFGVACGPIPLEGLIWWLAIPVAAGLGLWLAWRGGALRPLLAAAVTGVALALPYLFYVNYAAPRFLLPMYALLSLPVAHAVVAGMRLRRRPVAVAVVAGVAAHLALQGAYASRVVAAGSPYRQEVDLVVAELRRLGVHAPCMVHGEAGVPIGYLLGCSSKGIIRRFPRRPPYSVRQALRGESQVVAVGKRKPFPPYAATWTQVVLPGGWTAEFAPPATGVWTGGRGGGTY